LNLENEKGITINELIPINIKEKEFDLLMNIYRTASEQVLQLINGIKVEYENIYSHNIINHITSRIKSPDSILKKMNKKNLELNYRSLVENINDIAGIRIICPMKNDVYTMVNIIEKVPNWKIVKSKDYIKKPKTSGYSGYHIIIETPVSFYAEGEKNEIYVKVEIQIRTMAMDFWATNEHRMKYKSDKKLSFLDSKKLAFYAKILNVLDDKMMKLCKRQKYSKTQ